MKTIHKYPLKIEVISEINMPKKAKILKAGIDVHGEPAIWALIDPSHDLVPHRFIVMGTGHHIDDINLMNTEYVSSFNHQPTRTSLNFTWHIFHEIQNP